MIRRILGVIAFIIGLAVFAHIIIAAPANVSGTLRVFETITKGE